MTTFFAAKMRLFQKDNVLVNRRSESRLKRYISAHDSRSWSDHDEDKRNYINRLIKNTAPPCKIKIVPTEDLAKFLVKINGNENGEPRIKQKVRSYDWPISIRQTNSEAFASIQSSITYFAEENLEIIDIDERKKYVITDVGTSIEETIYNVNYDEVDGGTRIEETTAEAEESIDAPPVDFAKGIIISTPSRAHPVPKATFLGQDKIEDAITYLEVASSTDVIEDLINESSILIDDETVSAIEIIDTSKKAEKSSINDQNETDIATSDDGNKKSEESFKEIQNETSLVSEAISEPIVAEILFEPTILGKTQIEETSTLNNFIPQTKEAITDKNKFNTMEIEEKIVYYDEEVVDETTKLIDASVATKSVSLSSGVTSTSAEMLSKSSSIEINENTQTAESPIWSKTNSEIMKLVLEEPKVSKMSIEETISDSKYYNYEMVNPTLTLTDTFGKEKTEVVPNKTIILASRKLDSNNNKNLDLSSGKANPSGTEIWSKPTYSGQTEIETNKVPIFINPQIIDPLLEEAMLSLKNEKDALFDNIFDNKVTNETNKVDQTKEEIDKPKNLIIELEFADFRIRRTVSKEELYEGSNLRFENINKRLMNKNVDNIADEHFELLFDQEFEEHVFEEKFWPTQSTALENDSDYSIMVAEIDYEPNYHYKISEASHYNEEEFLIDNQNQNVPFLEQDLNNWRLQTKQLKKAFTRESCMVQPNELVQKQKISNIALTKGHHNAQGCMTNKHDINPCQATDFPCNDATAFAPCRPCLHYYTKPPCPTCKKVIGDRTHLNVILKPVEEVNTPIKNYVKRRYSSKMDNVFMSQIGLVEKKKSKTSITTDATTACHDLKNPCADKDISNVCLMKKNSLYTNLKAFCPAKQFLTFSTTSLPICKVCKKEQSDLCLLCSKDSPTQTSLLGLVEPFLAASKKSGINIKKVVEIFKDGEKKEEIVKEQNELKQGKNKQIIGGLKKGYKETDGSKKETVITVVGVESINNPEVPKVSSESNQVSNKNDFYAFIPTARSPDTPQTNNEDDKMYTSYAKFIPTIKPSDNPQTSNNNNPMNTSDAISFFPVRPPEDSRHNTEDDQTYTSNAIFVPTKGSPSNPQNDQIYTSYVPTKKPESGANESIQYLPIDLQTKKSKNVSKHPNQNITMQETDKDSTTKPQKVSKKSNNTDHKNKTRAFIIPTKRSIISNWVDQTTTKLENDSTSNKLEVCCVTPETNSKMCLFEKNASLCNKLNVSLSCESCDQHSETCDVCSKSTKRTSLHIILQNLNQSVLKNSKIDKGVSSNHSQIIESNQIPKLVAENKIIESEEDVNKNYEIKSNIEDQKIKEVFKADDNDFTPTYFPTKTSKKSDKFYTSYNKLDSAPKPQDDSKNVAISKLQDKATANQILTNKVSKKNDLTTNPQENLNGSYYYVSKSNKTYKSYLTPTKKAMKPIDSCESELLISIIDLEKSKDNIIMQSSNKTSLLIDEQPPEKIVINPKRFSRSLTNDLLKPIDVEAVHKLFQVDEAKNDKMERSNSSLMAPIDIEKLNRIFEVDQVKTKPESSKPTDKMRQSNSSIISNEYLLELINKQKTNNFQVDQENTNSERILKMGKTLASCQSCYKFFQNAACTMCQGLKTSSHNVVEEKLEKSESCADNKQNNGPTTDVLFRSDIEIKESDQMYTPIYNPTNRPKETVSKKICNVTNCLANRSNNNLSACSLCQIHDSKAVCNLCPKSLNRNSLIAFLEKPNLAIIPISSHATLLKLNQSCKEIEIPKLNQANIDSQNSSMELNEVMFKHFIPPLTDGKNLIETISCKFAALQEIHTDLVTTCMDQDETCLVSASQCLIKKHSSGTEVLISCDENEVCNTCHVTWARLEIKPDLCSLLQPFINAQKSCKYEYNSNEEIESYYDEATCSSYFTTSTDCGSKFCLPHSNYTSSSDTSNQTSDVSSTSQIQKIIIFNTIDESRSFSAELNTSSAESSFSMIIKNEIAPNYNSLMTKNENSDEIKQNWGNKDSELINKSSAAKFDISDTTFFIPIPTNLPPETTDTQQITLKSVEPETTSKLQPDTMKSNPNSSKKDQQTKSSKPESKSTKKTKKSKNNEKEEQENHFKGISILEHTGPPSSYHSLSDSSSESMRDVLRCTKFTDGCGNSDPCPCTICNDEDKDEPGTSEKK